MIISEVEGYLDYMGLINMMTNKALALPVMIVSNFTNIFTEINLKSSYHG